MKLNNITYNVINEYKLKDKDQDQFIYYEVRKGMYFTTSRPHSPTTARKIAKKHGYYQSTITPGFWKHKWQPV